MTTELSPIALALGRVPTGLYVVTSEAAGKPLGFVGSFLMQVGFRPPTLSVAVAQGREHLGAMRAHGRFAVSVLDGSCARRMGAFFKKYPPGETAFDHVTCAATPGGLAVLSEALAWFECRVSGEHATGDHVVLFGVVEHAALLREGEPSVHLRRDGLGY